jgi:hypothetical protein
MRGLIYFSWKVHPDNGQVSLTKRATILQIALLIYLLKPIGTEFLSAISIKAYHAVLLSFGRKDPLA